MIESPLSLVEGALARFVAGDAAGARRLVEAKADAEILKQPVHTLRSQKVMYGCAIATAVLFILGAIMAHWGATVLQATATR